MNEYKAIPMSTQIFGDNAGRFQKGKTLVNLREVQYEGEVEPDTDHEVIIGVQNQQNENDRNENNESKNEEERIIGGA